MGCPQDVEERCDPKAEIEATGSIRIFIYHEAEESPLRITAMVSFVSAVYIGSVSIAAQQPTNGLSKENPSGNLFWPPTKTPSSPRLLFPSPTLSQRPELRLAPKPTVVCGLTLIPADPKTDPAIRHDVPEDGPRFSIRSVDPHLCRRQ
jgi:hypothetical protein